MEVSGLQSFDVMAHSDVGEPKSERGNHHSCDEKEGRRKWGEGMQV